MRFSPHGGLFSFQRKMVGDHGNEFRIGGFSFQIAHGVAEKALQRFHVASVPCDLDGVADGALHSGGRGGEFLRDLRIERLSDGVDHIHIVDGEDDGLAQILITLDVGWHADLVDDVGDNGFEVALTLRLRGIISA